MGVGARLPYEFTQLRRLGKGGLGPQSSPIQEPRHVCVLWMPQAQDPPRSQAERGLGSSACLRFALFPIPQRELFRASARVTN